MDQEVRKYRKWVKLYQELGNAGTVCLRCGISRPTLRKWLKRYEENGLEGLKSHSRIPDNNPNRKVLEKLGEWIKDLRENRNLGARRIQSELIKHRNL